MSAPSTSRCRPYAARIQWYLPPQLLSAGSAREFRDIKADANAAPLPGREFRRTEHLLLRVPTFEPAGNAVQVSARLVNRVGAVLLDLAPMPDEASRTLTQFDLPLASSAPGEVFDQSCCPQRRRNRSRADPLPDHWLTSSCSPPSERTRSVILCCSSPSPWRLLPSSISAGAGTGIDTRLVAGRPAIGCSHGHTARVAAARVCQPRTCSCSCNLTMVIVYAATPAYYDYVEPSVASVSWIVGARAAGAIRVRRVPRCTACPMGRCCFSSTG